MKIYYYYFLNTSKTLIYFSGFVDMKIDFSKFKKKNSIFLNRFSAEYLGYSGFLTIGAHRIMIVTEVYDCI